MTPAPRRPAPPMNLPARAGSTMLPSPLGHRYLHISNSQSPRPACGERVRVRGGALPLPSPRPCMPQGGRGSSLRCVDTYLPLGTREHLQRSRRVGESEARGRRREETPRHAAIRNAHAVRLHHAIQGALAWASSDTSHCMQTILKPRRVFTKRLLPWCVFAAQPWHEQLGSILINYN